MKLFHILLSCSLSLSLLASCKGDKNDAPTPKEQYLSEVVTSTYAPKGSSTEVGELRSQLTERYNAKGQLIGTVSHSADKADEDIYTSYGYDASGKLLQKIETNAKSLNPITTSYKYDAQGRVIEEVITAADGTVQHTALSEYNDKGQLVRLLNTNVSSGSQVEALYSYNASGLRSESNLYMLLGDFKIHTLRTTYEYDAMGREILNTSYNTETNAVEKVLKTSYLTAQPQLIERTELTYTIESQTSTTINRFVYSLEQDNRWSKRIHYTDETIREISTREFKYSDL